MVTLKCMANVQDTSRQFFSFGFGNTLIKQFIPRPKNGNTIESPFIKEGGIYIELNFRWKKFGFNTGIEVISTGYIEKYPETNDTIHRSIGMEHSTWVFAYPLLLNYKLMDKKHWKVFLRTGFVLARFYSEKKKIYDYTPLSASTERYQTDSYSSLGFFPSFGVIAERNLYKRDICLNMQLNFNGLPVKGDFNHLALNLGLNIMLSNILFKDRVKTLQRYP